MAFILAARFKNPLPIILGIFLATLVNFMVWLVPWGADYRGTAPRSAALGIGRIVYCYGRLTLIPDKIEEEAKTANRQQTRRVWRHAHHLLWQNGR